MTENHFRSHFSPFQINTQLFIFFSKWPPAAILDPDFLPKSIGTSLYSRSVARSNMKLIGAFLMKLFSQNGRLAAIFFFRFSPKSIGFFHSRVSMAVSNMNLIRALLSQLRETQALACGGGDGDGDGVRTKTIIFPKFQISGI